MLLLVLLKCLDGPCRVSVFANSVLPFSCLCNGHADFCDNKTGSCNCQNNTEENCSARSTGEKECYKNQVTIYKWPVCWKKRI